MEVLGEGLKVRSPGDISQLPAKIIKAKKGDILFDVENGDITFRARNSAKGAEKILYMIATQDPFAPKARRLLFFTKIQNQNGAQNVSILYYVS